MAGKVLTSTVEMGRVTLVAKTEIAAPPQFTRTDFEDALKKVSRKRSNGNRTRSRSRRGTSG